MKRRIHGLWIAILAVILSIIIVPMPFQAETMDDPAPIIVPESPNGKKVLFDNMHAQTAGQADWVIDGAFSDFAEGIAENGYQVEELRKNSPFTLEDLEDYDVFVIPEANIPFKKVEQDAMVEYVENGGSIFFISDHYNADRNKNRWDSSEVMNGYRRGAHDNPTKGMSEDEKNSEAMQGIESSDWLSDNFGIRFRYNALGNIVANHIVDPDESFGITEGVEEVTMHAGSTLAITDPKLAKGIVYLPDGLDESDKWGPSVDQGIYHGGGIEEGPYAAISKLGKGKAAFIGDSSPVEDITPKYRNEETGKRKTTYDGFIDADNGTLLLNMVDWLAEEEAYEDFTETDIPLDEVSPLLDMEIPENSTEPQHEPWTNPQSHYKWYDPSTFAPGSFGSSVDPMPEPEFELNYDSVLPNDKVFTIEVVAEGLAPGQTISGYNLGIYLDGGQQIAKVQNEDGSWPSNFGYSSEFSLQANSEGVATKTLTVQLNENVVGDANVRLRQGGTNLITRPAVIASGVGEEEPEDPTEPDEPITEPEFTLNFNSVLPNNQEFTIEVVARGLEAGQTVTGYNLGIYLAGGQQIAKVKREDGSWPSSFGYSEDFSLQADSNGVAKKTLHVQVNENVEGDANVRLRQGKTRVVTEEAVIASVVEEEPEVELLTIKQARDLADGKIAMVEGVITTKPGLFGGKGFYIQDETAGIYVFQHADEYQVGDVIRIKGTLATFNGLKELEDVQHVEVIGESELPEYTLIEELDESNQGQRVSLEGEIENIVSYWNAFEFDLRNGEQLIKVRIDNRTNISFEEFTDLYEEGDQVIVSGISSIFHTPQLLVTDLEDIQLDANAAPVIHELAGFDQFVITESYQIPVDVYDEDGDLDRVVIEMNGNTMEDTIQISPLDFTPGTYEVKITASDKVGNVTEQTFTVEAVLLLSELDELVEFGVEQGYVAAKMEKRLVKKALDVQKAKNTPSRNGKWNALLNQMEAQLGKRIQNDYIDFWEKPIDM
ncbi:endonuclease [Aliibacillus thermotolerans]|uniref:Endonuclease n=1 Tax=Aliibacillus thermotolerans TaxID=1834418 RepID=A0ABW0U8W6_9BACI|nr:endonuclease [Aliibacillus thermotolerans]